jgi:predicted phage terminase large subunit-like protein
MPGWEKKIYKSIISWAKNGWLWKNWMGIYNYDKRYSSQTGPEVARRYFLEHKETMLEGTKVLWPEKEDYYSLMVMRENDGYASFDSEKQNEPIDPKTQLFNPDEFHYWDDKYDTEEDLLNSLGEEVEFYLACDPSIGKRSKNGDYSAIILLARDKETGKVYILVEDIKNRAPDELIEDLLIYCAKRNCKIVAVEANQFQEYLANEIEKRLNATGIYAPIEKIVHSTNKEKRIQSLQPFIKNGTIQFSRRQRMLIEQLKYFPKAAHDDGPDALEMAFQICKGDDVTDEPFWFEIDFDD